MNGAAWTKIRKALNKILTLPRTLAFHFQPLRRNGGPQRYAWCDGFTIGSGPWQCYCCHKLRNWIRGIKKLESKDANILNLGKMVFLRIYTHQGISYIWPSTKHIYPVAVLPFLDERRKQFETMEKERLKLIRNLQKIGGGKGGSNIRRRKPVASNPVCVNR